MTNVNPSNKNETKSDIFSWDIRHIYIFFVKNTKVFQ